MVGTLLGAHMQLQEVHRFRTPLIEIGGHLYWNIDELWNEVRRGLAKALTFAPQLHSISVDSWGVDYVDLDANGAPLHHPFAYRDGRTRGRLAEVFRRMPADQVYALTGTQFLPFNTLSQVFADLSDDPVGTARVAHRLLIADYLLYRLSGRMVAERTMASTTQLFDVTRMEWGDSLIRAIGDDRARYPEVVEPGTVLAPGMIDHEDSQRTRPAVIATCSHDTAAAVAAVPATGGESWAYISSGTWSLVGVERQRPMLTANARVAGFTNEIGVDGTIRLLKNRNGLWVLEECVREWGAGGEVPSWEELFDESAASAGSEAILDLNTAEFGEPGNMTAKLHAACRAVGAPVPSTRGELVRVVLESLAHSYAAVLDELETLCGERASVIHVVGGGARNQLLNQLTANACGRRVVAGPVEATVLGNLLLQARTLGLLPAGVTMRDVARESVTLAEFTPEPSHSARSARSIAS